MIEYRTFKNADPPGLVEVWNQAFTGRGAVRLQNPTWTEYFLFSKPYFDPDSLIIASDAGRIVGFAQAGFAANDRETALDPQRGVLCLLGVVPTHRRQGIGDELLRRAEIYLRGRGSQELFAGPMHPHNPYSFGLYGGASSPGFLASDPLARPFLERHGYTVASSQRVFQRLLRQPIAVSDARFAAHRLRYEIRANPFHGTTWWQECVLGPIELLEYRLQDKLTSRTVARALLWEMDTYSNRWNDHAIGITDLTVPSELRRQGLAKYLLAQLLRYLHEQFFNLVEIQTQTENTIAVSMLGGLGFQEVDAGHSFRKSP